MMSCWVPCIIEPGLFSQERIITITLANGQLVSLFGDIGILKEHEGRYYLSTTYVKDEMMDGIPVARVLLPDECEPTLTRWVAVKREDILYV